MRTESSFLFLYFNYVALWDFTVNMNTSGSSLDRHIGRTLWKLGIFSKRAVLWTYKMETKSFFPSSEDYFSSPVSKGKLNTSIFLNVFALLNIWGTFKGCGNLKWWRKVSLQFLFFLYCCKLYLQGFVYLFSWLTTCTRMIQLVVMGRS